MADRPGDPQTCSRQRRRLPAGSADRHRVAAHDRGDPGPGGILLRRLGLLPFRRFAPCGAGTAIAVNLVLYVASAIPSTLFDTREIAAVLPFGAVLAGRLLARPLIRARLTPVLAGVLALYVVALGYGVSQPRAGNTEQALVGWLEAHHLSTGLGTYTEDNVTTVDQRRPGPDADRSWQPSGGVPRVSQSTASWYDPRTHYADFVLTNTADGRASLIPRHEILALAGPPRARTTSGLSPSWSGTRTCSTTSGRRRRARLGTSVTPKHFLCGGTDPRGASHCSHCR